MTIKANIISAIFTGLILTLAPISASAMDKTSIDTTSEAVGLKNLKLLEGTWREKGTDSTLEINFEMIARNSTLVETWSRDGNNFAITVYHQDGQDLIATHYCPQGNQPRLKMVSTSSPQHINFNFMDVTNLNETQKYHQDTLSLKLPVNGSDFIRSESYKGADSTSESVLVLERAAP